MFKNEYKNVMAHFNPDERLIQSTIDHSTEQTAPAPKALPLRRWLVPAVAAVLVFTVALSILLIPHGAQHSFTLTAAAAENSPLRGDTYVQIGELNWGGGGYTTDHVSDEFLADISVIGEDIESITYRTNAGKIGLVNSRLRLTDYTNKEDAVYYDNGYFRGEGYSYYDSVTCAYDNPFTAEDGMCFTVQGDIGTDFDAKIAMRYLNVNMKLHEADITTPDVTAEEIHDAYYAYYNEVLKDVRMYITVTYTDGSTETQAISFKADVEVTPVHRRFHAYNYDENGEPYPVTDTLRDVPSFELREEFNWEESEEYNRVKHIFNDDNLIEFDDYEESVALFARLEK